jgi:hypothetical protein
MSVQLTFTVATSSKAHSAHLLGSWDNYKSQLPLSCKDRSGDWRGTFKIPTSIVKPGSRYWYYYIIDGSKVSHDPSTSFTREPTTGRNLNILDVPKSSSHSSTLQSKSQRSANRASMEVPKGRSLSPSKIVHPKPSKPYASRAVREADYSVSPGMEDLADKLEHASLYTMPRNISPPSSVGSSISSRSSDRSSPESLSSLSDSSRSSCSCNRYGLTRSGKKVLLDCGGKRCGGSEESSSCSSVDESDETSESESEEERPRYKTKSIAPSSRRAAPTSGGRRR